MVTSLTSAAEREVDLAVSLSDADALPTLANRRQMKCCGLSSVLFFYSADLRISPGDVCVTPFFCTDSLKGPTCCKALYGVSFIKKPSENKH